MTEFAKMGFLRAHARWANSVRAEHAISQIPQSDTGASGHVRDHGHGALDRVVRDRVLRSRVETHPRLLARSKIPLTIVCGPPCSGKTTYVAEHKSDGDVVIDLDEIAAKLDPDFKPWSQTNVSLLMRSLKIRNQILLTLARRLTGKAWIIVGAPTQAERDWWKLRLGGEVVLLSVAADECKRRAIERGTPLAISGVDSWFAASGQLWIQPQYHPPIAEDGWPYDD